MQWMIFLGQCSCFLLFSAHFPLERVINVLSSAHFEGSDPITIAVPIYIKIPCEFEACDSGSKFIVMVNQVLQTVLGFYIFFHSHTELLLNGLLSNG
jgi:hypothetical protein